MANPFDRFKVRYAAAEYVFKDGDVGTEMFIVQSGRVALVKEVLGREEVVAELEKGDFFGEMAVLESLPRNLGARVLEPAELIAINSSTFDKMIKSNIEISVRMLRKFSSRIREADEENVRLMHRNRALEEGSGVSLPTAATPAPAFVAAKREAAAAAAAVAESKVAPPPAAAVVVNAPVKSPAGSAPPATSPAASTPATSPTPRPTPTAAPVAPLRKAAHLMVKGTERKYSLTSDDITIGRADPVTGLRPEIDLSTEDVNRFISRRHAKILYKDGTYYLVEEVGVTNGTYLNGKRLQGGVYSPIRHGDELCFGKVFVTFLEGA